MEWINIFGLIIVILMLVPKMIYACKNKNAKNQCTDRLMNTVEQIGRYGSMFLMAFNIGIAEFGFKSKNGFSTWLIGISILIVLYWISWVLYFKEPKIHFAMQLAIIPSAVFIFSGLILRHWLLVLFGVAFSVGHIYVTYQNNRTE